MKYLTAKTLPNHGTPLLEMKRLGIEPEHGIAAIGSGGAFAQAAARALVEYTEMPMAEVAEQALKIAAEICVFTNDQIIVETLT